MWITRRSMIGGVLTVAAMTAASQRMGFAMTTKPKIAITFDEWKTTATEAFPVFLDYPNVRATYFVSPAYIDTASGPSASTLLAMKQSGWEIGVYSGVHFPDMEYNSRIDANVKMLALKDQMRAKGFPVTSMSAGQRAWNQKCRMLAEGIFTHVRVVDNFTWQAQPIPDRLWVKDGGTASFSDTDTAASLIGQLNSVIASGGIWIPVIHRTSDDGTDPVYTVKKTAVLRPFVEAVSNAVAAGTIESVRFCDL